MCITTGPAASWMPAERSPRARPKVFSLTPRFSSPQSLFRKVNHLARRPSRRTLGVGVATVATVAGVWAGVAATATPAAGTVSSLGAVSHVGALHPAGHAGALAAPKGSAPSVHATAQGDRHNAPARQAAPHAAPAQRPRKPAAQARAASAQHTRRQAAAQHAARSQHQAAVRSRAPQHSTPAVQHAAAVNHAPAVHSAAAAHTAAVAQHAVAHHATVAHHAARRHGAGPRHRSMPAQPYQIYDSVTPSAIPANHPIATYANGGYAVSPSQVAGRHVLWIDTNGSDPAASALDVEPGDATPSQAASWAASRLTAYPHAQAIIYTMQSQWPAAQAAVATLPTWMQHHIRWWIADPTGVPHILPGASATQWYWGSNYDISTAAPGF
jgi:hypothetical protein